MTSNPSAVDTHDMLLVHRLIRREIGALPRLFRAASGDPARAKVVAAHAAEMLEFLHVHHSGEDELLYPLLRERVTLDQALLDRMDAQHHEVDVAVQKVAADLSDWSSTADAAAGERMAVALEGMLPILVEHLAEEEAELLPIVSVTVSQSEWDALGKHGLGAIPPKRRLVILGHLVEEADDAERKQMLLNVPPPARLAFKLVGRRQHAREAARIRG